MVTGHTPPKTCLHIFKKKFPEIFNDQYNKQNLTNSLRTPKITLIENVPTMTFTNVN